MWDALQDVARNITLLLDGGSGSHRKCPRCRGSGLLKTSFTKWEKNDAHPNQACWFCEGIGVLPIVGLNGFVLARATPCIGALDKQKQFCKEAPHVDACMHGKETVKFTKRKLKVGFADLLFDCKTSWIDELKNCAKGSSIKQEITMGIQKDISKSLKAKSSMQPSKWEQTFQLHSSLPMLQPVPRIGNSTSASDSVLYPSAINVIYPSASLNVPSPFSSAVLGRCATSGCNNRVGLGRCLSFTPRTSDSVSSINNRESGIDVSGQLIMGPDLQAKSSILCTRKRRPPRKTRNCIRDKARKEAMERARVFVGGLKYLQVEEAVSVQSYRQSGPFDESSSDAKSKECMLQEELLPVEMAPKTARLTGLAGYQQLRSHQMLSATFKALMLSERYDSAQKQRVITAP